MKVYVYVYVKGEKMDKIRSAEDSEILDISRMLFGLAKSLGRSAKEK